MRNSRALAAAIVLAFVFARAHLFRLMIIRRLLSAKWERGGDEARAEGHGEAERKVETERRARESESNYFPQCFGIICPLSVGPDGQLALARKASSHSTRSDWRKNKSLPHMTQSTGKYCFTFFPVSPYVLREFVVPLGSAVEMSATREQTN